MLDSASIEGLTSSCLAWRYDEPRPIPELHREMWRECCSPDLQVAIAAPRGHAKSTAITFAYALSLVLFRESRHLLIISANESLASDFLNDIRIELQENEKLTALFGGFRFLKEAETEIIVQFIKTKEKFRIIVKGAGQRMRGLKWERKRPDTVIGDDLEDDEIVLNAERREKFRRWFYGAVRPIVRSGGKIRLVGTIIHLDSLLERTMPKLTHENSRESPLKIWSVAPQKGWRATKYRAHDHDYDNILWPEMFTADKLKAIRHEFAEMGLLDVYGQEYLNDPIDDTTAYFRRGDFLPMDPGDHERRKMFYVGVDLAISEKKKAAYTALVVGGVDKDKILHIVDVRRGRWDTWGIIEEIFSVHRRWNPDIFRFESENIEKALRPVLETEMIRRQIYLRFDTASPTADKIQRSRAFQYRMRAGGVKFDKQADWYADYEEELAHFPKWPSLDQVDASAWLGLLLSEELTAPTDKEIDTETYNFMLQSDSDMGRSAVTGY